MRVLCVWVEGELCVWVEGELCMGVCVCLEGEIRLVRYTGTESELQEI